MGEDISLIVDVRLRRPACVLLQAVYGCRHAPVSSFFDPGTWLTAPTDDMRRVSGTIEQWRGFAAECNATHGRKRSAQPTDTDRPERSA